MQEANLTGGPLAANLLFVVPSNRALLRVIRPDRRVEVPENAPATSQLPNAAGCSLYIALKIPKAATASLLLFHGVPLAMEMGSRPGAQLARSVVMR